MDHRSPKLNMKGFLFSNILKNTKMDDGSDATDDDSKLSRQPLAGPSPDGHSSGEMSTLPTSALACAKKSARKFKKAPRAPKRFRSGTRLTAEDITHCIEAKSLQMSNFPKAFIFFSQHKHKEIQETLARQGESEKTTSVAKMVSEEWRRMGPKERRKWDQMALEDKTRFEKEKAAYKGPWTVPIGHRKSKDPAAPKRPASAFLAFSNSRRAAVKRENMEASNAEISRTLSKMWKEAPTKIRKIYLDEEAELRKAYKIRIAEWRKKNKDKNTATGHQEMIDRIHSDTAPSQVNSSVATATPAYEAAYGETVTLEEQTRPSHSKPHVRSRGSSLQGVVPTKSRQLVNPNSVETERRELISASSMKGSGAESESAAYNHAVDMEQSEALFAFDRGQAQSGEQQSLGDIAGIGSLVTESTRIAGRPFPSERTTPDSRESLETRASNETRHNSFVRLTPTFSQLRTDNTDNRLPLGRSHLAGHQHSFGGNAGNALQDNVTRLRSGVGPLQVGLDGRFAATDAHSGHQLNSDGNQRLYWNSLSRNQAGTSQTKSQNQALGSLLFGQNLRDQHQALLNIQQQQQQLLNLPNMQRAQEHRNRRPPPEDETERKGK